MLPRMTGEIITQFFAWAPLTVFLIIVLVAYLSLRSQAPAHVPLGKTYACAGCGRRGKHEHMVPVTHEGAVIWYCARCAR